MRRVSASSLEYLIGDTAYGNAATLGWLVNEKQIDPYIPVCSRADRREEIIPSNDFTWDERKDEYRCPGGQRLRREWRSFKTPRAHITKAATIIYRSSQRDCITGARDEFLLAAIAQNLRRMAKLTAEDPAKC